MASTAPIALGSLNAETNSLALGGRELNTLVSCGIRAMVMGIPK